MNARHLAFIVFRRRFPTEACLTCIALPQLPPARAAAATPRTAAATRAAPVAPLLPGAAVGIGTGVEGLDVLGLEILIRISVVIPVWKSTSELAHPEHNCETFVNPHAIEQTQLHEQRRVESRCSEI